MQGFVTFNTFTYVKGDVMGRAYNTHGGEEEGI
jgi:hypothetical protein